MYLCTSANKKLLVTFIFGNLTALAMVWEFGAPEFERFIRTNFEKSKF